MGTGERERPCFQMVPIWEPRFLYSSHSGVACHPSADAKHRHFSSELRYRPHAGSFQQPDRDGSRVAAGYASAISSTH